MGWKRIWNRSRAERSEVQPSAARRSRAERSRGKAGQSSANVQADRVVGASTISKSGSVPPGPAVPRRSSSSRNHLLHRHRDDRISLRFDNVVGITEKDAGPAPPDSRDTERWRGIGFLPPDKPRVQRGASDGPAVIPGICVAHDMLFPDPTVPEAIAQSCHDVLRE